MNRLLRQHFLSLIILCIIFLPVLQTQAAMTFRPKQYFANNQYTECLVVTSDSLEAIIHNNCRKNQPVKITGMAFSAHDVSLL